jgi:hypothetical protein
MVISMYLATSVLNTVQTVERIQRLQVMYAEAAANRYDKQIDRTVQVTLYTISAGKIRRAKAVTVYRFRARQTRRCF